MMESDLPPFSTFTTGRMADKTEKKKARGSVVIMAERCKGCGFCVEFCPPDALKLSEQYNQKGYHPPILISEELCNGCNICGLMCPDFAIYGFIYMKKKPVGANPTAGGKIES